MGEMNTIGGKVVVKGLGVGIPDLLVVIYDIDPQNLSQIKVGMSLSDAASDDINTPELRRAELEWIAHGDRLGSVLTDPRGRFELKYEDEEFQIRNTEKRPDLTLFVMAPDESWADTRIGLPPRYRILHYTFIPRPNAGRVESYIIAIKPHFLDTYGIRYPGRAFNPQAMADDLEENFKFYADYREKTLGLIKPIITARASQIKATHEVRTEAWRWLAQPAGAVASRYFAPPDTSASEVQEVAVIDGAGRLGAYAGRGSIWLAGHELEDLGIDLGRLRGGDAVSVNMCDVLALKGMGSSLVRVRELLDSVHARRRSDAAMSDTPGTSPPANNGSGADGSVVVVSDEEARDRIRSRILGQIEEMPEFGQGADETALSDLEKVKEAINKVELTGGPANVTAFHDFHSLQVAFKHVWTAAFDERLRDQAVELYNAATELHEEYGLEIPDIDAINDVNDYLRFLNELNDSLRYADAIAVDRYVQQVFPQMDLVTWNRLDDAGRSALSGAARTYLDWAERPEQIDDFGRPIEPPPYARREYIDEYYETILRSYTKSPLAKAERLILEMSERLRQPYAFHYFAPGTVNFGILLTYRQQWTPETYQVGRLVATLPLAPGEKRTFKVNHVVKKTRAQKEIEKALLERSAEAQVTSRAEAEVMSKTATTTNFRMTAQGTFSLGVVQLQTTNEFGMNQSQESSQTKKAFNEATKKSAESVRQEREVQVELTETDELTSEATHEISNPNNELTVTYLLYELERRYFISSRLHRVTPVIMVAMDIPAPHEITETWVLEHTWILRRVLLDDGLLDSLRYIEEGSAADATDIEIKKANWRTQHDLVDRLEESLQDFIDMREARRTELVRLALDRDTAAAGESDVDDIARAIFSGGLSLLFGGGGPDRSELLEAQRKAIEQTLEHIQSRIDELQGRLSRARGALQQATDEYTNALKEKARKDTLVNQALLHFRQNILHYMHAIWDSTHPDQLFFQLYHQEVQLLEPASRTCTLRLATDAERSAGVPGIERDGEFYIMECSPPETPDPTRDFMTKQLAEVADLDNPLGYKGNYILFPMRECTYIADFMMQEFIDDYFGVRDPDTNDSYTTEELLEYAAEIWNDPSVTLSEDEQDALRHLVLQKLTSPRHNHDTIIVPTGQLYMEALKGEQALLEDFKMAHRGMDVLKVQEEVREARLENLRRVARLVEGEHEDPDIDRHIVVDGTDDVLIET